MEGQPTPSVPAAPISPRSMTIELAVVTASVLFVARLLFLARGVPFIAQSLSTIVAIVLIYAPIAALWFRRRPIDFLDRGAHAYARSGLAFLLAAAIVFPPFGAAACAWLKVVVGVEGFRWLPFPNFWSVLAYQLILVALPEEFFFRGYFQSAMKRICPARWRILGIEIGWGFFITAVVFAFAHSVIISRWWHFAIIFPALVFGYLRERTGSITAPILFHASSNILMDLVVRSCV